MPHIITYTEEIEEHGYCQQRPELRTGDKYLYEEEGNKRLHIVLSVHFDKYVWENVAQWTTTIMEFFEDEYKLKEFPINIGTPDCVDVPVFIANSLMGVLTCDKDKIRGELFIPGNYGIWVIRGVAPFGFYDCRQLETVNLSPEVLVAYEYAFAKTGITKIIFHEEQQRLPTLFHITAVDDCQNLPKFDKLLDRPFSGRYLFRGGEAFREWEEELNRLHYL